MIVCELSWPALWLATDAAGVPIETFLAAPLLDLADERLARLAIGAGRRELLALQHAAPAHVQQVIAALGRFADRPNTAARTVSGVTIVQASDAEATTVVAIAEDGTNCSVTVLPVSNVDSVVLGSARSVPPLHGVARDPAVGTTRSDVGLHAVDGRLALDGDRRLGPTDVRAVLDTPDGAALVRLDTAEYGTVHLLAARADGRIDVALDDDGEHGLGPVLGARTGEEAISLEGAFGVIELPPTTRVVAIDRWRGDPRSTGAPTVIAEILEAPEVEVRIARQGSGELVEDVLSVRGEHGLHQSSRSPSVAVFVGQDLLLRTLDLAGLLTHPLVADAAADGSSPDGAGRQVDVHVVRVDPDGALVGGTACWGELGRRGHVVRVDGDAGTAQIQQVGELVEELLDHFGISERLR